MEIVHIKNMRMKHGITNLNRITIVAKPIYKPTIENGDLQNEASLEHWKIYERFELEDKASFIMLPTKDVTPHSYYRGYVNGKRLDCHIFRWIDSIAVYAFGDSNEIKDIRKAFRFNEYDIIWED